jgi:hypothetical protein
MLTDPQVNDVWSEMIGAEVRSLYFADLGAKYTKTKQVITGIAFFLSSGAAATILGKSPVWVPVLFSIVTAVATAYSIAVGLDRKAASMAKLHYTWSQIESDYRRLWNHWYEDDAEDQLKDILLRVREASQTAITEAPYDENLVKKWRSFVLKQHHIAPA